MTQRATCDNYCGFSSDIARHEHSSVCETKYAASQPIVIDLYRVMFDSLLEAAQESKWMPPEYMVNDWVADCRHLLIDGPFDPEPLRKELSAAGRNNYLLQESMQQLVDYADRLNKYIDYLAADFEIDLNSDEMRKRPTAPKANAELKLQKRITELEDEVKTLERELRDAEIDNTRLEQSLRGDY